MMIDTQSIAALVFIVLLTIFLYLKRSKLHFQKFLFPLFYILMYKSRFGLNFMEKISGKFPRLLKFLSYAGVFVGFFGMIFIAFTLVNTIYTTLTTPAASPGVALVLPIQVKGAFYVPFFYWIISIFILAIIHEFSHGVVARLHKIRVKASGFAFIGILLPILPAAFVEPDEEQLKKKPAKQQLAVFAAGSFANILFGLIMMGLFVLAVPAAVSSLTEPDGVFISGLEPDFPAEQTGLVPGEVITAIDDIPTTDLDSLSAYLETKSPGDDITITTKNASYPITLAADPEDETRGYLGVYLAPNSELKPVFQKYSFIPAIVFWFLGLMYWLYLLNIGIGLFNLVPVGPLDGGRMLKVAIKHRFKFKGEKFANLISLLFLFIIVFNLAFSFFN